MTLVTGVSYADKFVLMSGDLMELRSEYDVDLVDNTTKQGHLYATGGTRNKVIQINDYVLMSTAGLSDVAEAVEGKLRSKLRKTDDLSAAGIALREIITELKALSVDEATDADMRFSYRSLFVDEAPSTSIFLSGFYRDGRTGLVRYQCGKDSEVYEDENPVSGEYYSGFAEGVGASHLEYPFDLGGAALTLDNFIYQITQLHAYISVANPNLVSSDYELYLMFKEPDSVPEVVRWTLDAAVYYDRIRGVDTSAFVSPMNEYVSSEVSV